MIKKFREFNESLTEENILNDILSVNESIDFGSTLEKVKKYASKGLLTAAILATLMSSKAFSQTQKDQIKAAANIESVNKSNILISPSMRADWNNFIDWIAQKYPQGVSDKGSDPTAEIVNSYNKSNPNSSISISSISSFQKDLIQYNTKWKTLQSNYHDGGGYINAGSPVDGRIGSVTSKFKFPDVKIDGIDYKTDIDAAIKAAGSAKDNEVYIDPNLTPAQRFQHNQELRVKGQKPPTNAEHRSDSLRNANNK